MEKYDSIVLLMMAVAVLAVTFASQESYGTKAVENLADDTVLNAQTLAPEKPAAKPADEFNEKTFATENGLELVVGSVEMTNDTKEVALPLVDRKLNFSVDLPANKTLQYARIKGILVVPESPVSIDTGLTSYYPQGKVLEAGFQCPGVNGISIYSSNGAPAMILTNSSMNWNYDATTGITSISTGNPVCHLLAYWDRFVSGSDTFIEDTRESEKLWYLIRNAESGNIIANMSIELEQKPVDELNKKHSELQDKTEKVIFRKQELQNKVAELTASSIKLNRTQAGLANKTAALENTISSNVLVSPMNAGIGGIVGLILVILLIDVFFLRGGKDEE